MYQKDKGCKGGIDLNMSTILNLTDPSGHVICDEEGDCFENGKRVAGVKTGTPIQYSGFAENYMKKLITMIATESYSGKVMDNVNYMKNLDIYGDFCI